VFERIGSVNDSAHKHGPLPPPSGATTITWPTETTYTTRHHYADLSLMALVYFLVALQFACDCCFF